VTIVIAGGSGFLGRKLAKRLQSEGHTVVTLTRRPTGNGGEVAWQPDGEPGGLPRHLEGTDALVNLAGEGIADKRWTAARKQALRSSRILSTRTLVRAVTLCARPPRVFVSGSGKDYYGGRDAAPVSETAEPGSDFLAKLCVDWEQEARMVESPSTRVAIVRTGLALDRDGGALARMLLPFKLGLGATIASGDQIMSWIHVDDWTAMVSWLIRDERARGPFNATSPEPVTNRAFTRTLGRVLHRPAVLHAPALVLRAALGELATALIEGQSAVPAHAERLGFRFTHRALEPALESLNL
jgi:uncharacterized protein